MADVLRVRRVVADGGLAVSAPLLLLQVARRARGRATATTRAIMMRPGMKRARKAIMMRLMGEASA
jgi:hypothetical protein